MRQDDQAGGAIPALGGRDFLTLLPEDIAEIEVEEYCNLPSAHFTLDTIWGMRHRVAELAEDEDVQGIVITHGTDVMEETAYLLDLTVDTDKPIVLTGAMRTASEVGYDGIANLLAAIRVAASDNSQRLGALVDPDGRWYWTDRNPPDMDKVRELAKYKDFNADYIRETNPVLARWLSNPDNAAIAGDDLSTTSGLGWAFKSAIAAANVGFGPGSPDPAQRKVLVVDFLYSGDDPGQPWDWDSHDHGTHVAGTIAGDNPVSPGTRDGVDGMAPAAKILNAIHGTFTSCMNAMVSSWL